MLSLSELALHGALLDGSSTVPWRMKQFPACNRRWLAMQCHRIDQPERTDNASARAGSSRSYPTRLDGVLDCPISTRVWPGLSWVMPMDQGVDSEPTNAKQRLSSFSAHAQTSIRSQKIFPIFDPTFSSFVPTDLIVVYILPSVALSCDALASRAGQHRHLIVFNYFSRFFPYSPSLQSIPRTSPNPLPLHSTLAISDTAIIFITVAH